MDFVFNIEAVPKGRPRVTKSGHVYTPAKTRMFERQMKHLLSRQWAGKPITGPVEVIVTCEMRKPKSAKRFWPSVRPDVDNLCKSVLDSIQGEQGIILDDSQVCSLTCRKTYILNDQGHPRVLVSVNQLIEPALLSRDNQ